MKRIRGISLNWTRLVLNEKPENGTRQPRRDHPLRYVRHVFHRWRIYRGLGCSALQQNFAVKGKKTCDGTWRAIIKTGESNAGGTIRLTIALGKLNLRVASVRATCIRCMLPATACKSFATCIRNHSVHAFPRGTYALRDAPQREAATMYVLTSSR